MSKLNFSVFVDKVESGLKTQTIQPWNQPSIQKMKVGDKVALWWTKRGLKKGTYCQRCAKKGVYYATQLHTHDGHFTRLVTLPRRLGVGTIIRKYKVKLSSDQGKFTVRDSGGLLPKVNRNLLVRQEGFESEEAMRVWFDSRYGISKKPMEFAVLRWRLEK